MNEKHSTWGSVSLLLAIVAACPFLLVVGVFLVGVIHESTGGDPQKYAGLATAVAVIAGPLCILGVLGELTAIVLSVVGMAFDHNKFFAVAGFLTSLLGPIIVMILLILSLPS